MRFARNWNNDWRNGCRKYGDIALAECRFDWFVGSNYYFTFRLLGFGFTIGLWDDTEHNAALAEIKSWRTMNEAIRDDPEAHGVTSVTHYGAQDFTPTVEHADKCGCPPIPEGCTFYRGLSEVQNFGANPVNQRDEE